MRQILWFSFLVCIGCYVSGPVVDPDLWWHIAAGRWILAHGGVPQIDYWNMFGAGKAWCAYSWSNEIVYALADRIAGVQGLLVLQILLAAGIVFSFAIAFGLLAQDWFAGALLAAFGAGACASHYTLRPQSLVWIFFVWLFYEAHRIHEEGLTSKRALRIFAIFVLWANTHVTMIVGLGVLFSLAYSRRKSRAAFIATGLGFLATFVSPYFGGEWFAFFNQAEHPLDMRSIVEFQAATIMQYPTAFLLLSLLLYVLLILRGGKLEIMRGLGLAAAALAGLTVIKFLPLATLYAVGLVAIEWARVRPLAKTFPLVEACERLRALVLEKIPPEGFSFLLFCLCAVLVHGLFQGPVNNSVVPVAAVDFIEQNNLGHPILNDFGRGGYLIYRFSDRDGAPKYLAAIDGRTNVIPKEIWDKHQAAFFGRENWRAYFDAVKPETVLWPNESPLLAILEATKEWCRVFKSGDKNQGFSVFIPRAIFEKRTPPLRSDNCASAS